MSISGVEKVSGICFLYRICSSSLCLVNLDGQASLPDSINFGFIIGAWYGCRLTSMFLYDCDSLSVAKRSMIKSTRNIEFVVLTLQVQFVLELMARTLTYSLYKLMVLGLHFPSSISFQFLLLRLLLETC